MSFNFLDTTVAVYFPIHHRRYKSPPLPPPTGLLDPRELTTKTVKIVAKSTTHLLDTVLYLPTDGIYHASFQFRAYLPNLQIAHFPHSFKLKLYRVTDMYE